MAADDGIEGTIHGDPFDDYWTKLRTQLSAGSAPCIVTIQSLRAANLADVLLPLDDLASKADLDLTEFDTTALDAMKVGGKIYTLPYDTGPVVMCHNKEFFAEASVAEPLPGWSVEDFEAAGAAFKAKNMSLFASSVEDLFLQSTALACNAGRVVTEQGDLDMTNGKFSEGVEWIAGRWEANIRRKQVQTTPPTRITPTVVRLRPTSVDRGHCSTRRAKRHSISAS